MRLHRFYTKQELTPGKEVTIDSPELVNQIRRVFRLKNGDEIVLFTGTHFDYICKIDDPSDRSTIVGTNSIRLQVISKNRSRFTSQRTLYLCAGLVKKDTFEWIVEKATELGVSDIIPVSLERSEKKSLNEDRLKKIAIEASEQSGRGSIPMVHPIMGLKDATEYLKKEKNIKIVAFHTEGELFDRGEVRGEEPLAVFIGPEGGWSPAELDMFHGLDVPVRSLGTQILRAETAVVAALSLVVLGK